MQFDSNKNSIDNIKYSNAKLVYKTALTFSMLTRILNATMMKMLKIMDSLNVVVPIQLLSLMYSKQYYRKDKGLWK